MDCPFAQRQNPGASEVLIRRLAGSLTPQARQGLGGSLLESRFSDTALAWPCHGREDALLTGCGCIQAEVEPADAVNTVSYVNAVTFA